MTKKSQNRIEKDSQEETNKEINEVVKRLNDIFAETNTILVPFLEYTKTGIIPKVTIVKKNEPERNLSAEVKSS